MNDPLLFYLDILISILAFVFLAGTLYLYSIIQNERFADIKSRLFHRFKEIKTWMALALSSIFFLAGAVTLNLSMAPDLPFIYKVIGRLNLIFFEILALSVIPIARILEGNKKRKLSFYHHTLKRLKE